VEYACPRSVQQTDRRKVSFAGQDIHFGNRQIGEQKIMCLLNREDQKLSDAKPSQTMAAEPASSRVHDQRHCQLDKLRFVIGTLVVILQMKRAMPTARPVMARNAGPGSAWTRLHQPPL